MDKDCLEMCTPLLASGAKNESEDSKPDSRIINLRTNSPVELGDSSHRILAGAVEQSQPREDGDYYYVFQFQNPFYNHTMFGTDSKVSISSAKELFNKAFKVFATREKAFSALKEAQDASSISLQDLSIENWQEFEAQAKSTEVLQRDLMKHIINTVLEILQRILKFRVDIFFSRDDDELFLKIWATEDNLRIHAKNTDYILQLRVNPEDEIAIFNKVPPYAPFEMDIKVPTETPGVTKMRDIEHLYKHYDKIDREIKTQKLQQEASSLFMGKDKIRLIYDQISSMFDPDYLVEIGLMIAHFPVHNTDRLEVLKKNWVNDWRFWKKMRLNLVRSYFGEKIAIYFAWLEYFTSWLKFASLIGIIAYIAENVYGDVTESTFSMSVSEFSILFYTILICISASIVDLFWVRNEKYIALRWGTTVLDNYEGQRPAFKGEYKKDYITGRYKKFPKNPLKLKIFKILNMSVVMMFIAIIVAITFTIISWRVMRMKSGLSLLVCDIVNGIQIQVMKYVYDRVAKWLNELENYETNTEYNDALTLKLYLFQFVNSYASLCYLAFAKKFMEGCNQGDCMGELSDALQCIFLVKFVTNLLDIFIP